jgi:hypothetical protein
MLSQNDLSPPDARPNGRTHAGMEILPSEADRLSFEISLGRLRQGPNVVRLARCRTATEGHFCNVDFAQAMPPRLAHHPSGPSSEINRQEMSLASLVSLLSISIRANAFVRDIRIWSLQVEATVDSRPQMGKSDTAKVVVTLDADAPRSVVEGLVADVAKWAPDPALAGFAGRFEISLR